MGKRVPEVTDEMLRQAEELAGYGLTLPQIAAVLGFSERTIHRQKKDNDALEAAIRRGKAKASAIVGKSLFTKAKDGDVPAIRWWEMTRDGRSERTENQTHVEISTKAETDARLARLMGCDVPLIEAGDIGEDDASGP